MYVCVAGKNSIAVEALSSLINIVPRESLLACVNRTDDGNNSWQPSYASFCLSENIPIVELDELYKYSDLIFFSLEYDRIIKPELFPHDRLYNIHFSALPAYKGMFTSVMPLLRAETYSGVTLHCIDRGIDTGAIIDQILFDIPEDANALDLYTLYLKNSLSLFTRNLHNILNGKVDSKLQSSLGASYFSKSTIDFKNLGINFRKTAFEIKNQVRAFAFRHYQLLQYEDFKVSHVEITTEQSQFKPGTLLSENNFSFRISSIDYDIILYKDMIDEILRLSENGDTEQLSFYHTKGYKLYEKNINGWNAIIVAAYHGQLEACKLLVQIGLSPNSTNNNGTSVLMYAMTQASKSNNLEVMHYLIDAGANVHHRDFKGISLFEYATMYGNEKIINFLESFANHQYR